ncbi:hypothetical protein M5K25_006968 [Dendrobium thyrsiflorum]|uniref:Uncharacterized protein n=1 Tax=Dendrobium thyrsiflorum TaxID=117978 RepID=A0ABD0VCP4_DENTH
MICFTLLPDTLEYEIHLQYVLLLEDRLNEEWVKEMLVGNAIIYRNELDDLLHSCLVGISDKQMAGYLLSGVFLTTILLPEPSATFSTTKLMPQNGCHLTAIPNCTLSNLGKVQHTPSTVRESGLKTR